MDAKVAAHISAAIEAATQRPFALRSFTPVGGGDINASYRIESTEGGCYFVKLNSPQRQAMFAAEAVGLQAIADTGAICVPQVIAQGEAEQQSFLVLEHLPLGSRNNDKLLGAQLAALHKNTAAQFGFVQDNFIGSTPQPNSWCGDWIPFWREHRLGFQLQLAKENGYGGKLQTLGQSLLDALPTFFADHTPQPSLLHGDLWSGNHGFLADDTPVIFDPAAYYGDRECDLAMTELFGGYSADFYAAYRNAFPLDAGYEMRRDLYNLYHILNHANLFGGGYAQQAEAMMQKLLSRV
jgi:fructosamine-3-kinase